MQLAIDSNSELKSKERATSSSGIFEFKIVTIEYIWFFFKKKSTGVAAVDGKWCI
jgi:hypothetical protein